MSNDMDTDDTFPTESESDSGWNQRNRHLRDEPPVCDGA